MNTRYLCLALALLSNCGLGRLQAAETFESLAKRIPAGANALVLIDVEQTLAAPLAREQGWARKLETAYVQRPVFLPPEAKKLALGASLDADNDFLNRWEVAVMELAEPVGVRAIARSEQGYVDQINGQQAAITPLDAAFVDLGNGVLAAVQPADRQFLSRWISSARDYPSLVLSDYLKSSLPLVNDRVQVMLMVDLTDVLGPRDIESKLATAAWLKDKHADVSQIASILQTLKGATLRLAIGKDCQAQLQIDFGADVAPLEKFAKPAVLAALANLGFRTDELSKWKVSLGPRAIRMQGELSSDGQRRVFSVIELPKADLAAEGAAPGEAAKVSESEMRERSLAYFKSTETLIHDLRAGLTDTKATSAWMERYARRIDDLPVLDVDELLLDYGDKLAETLRIMALSKRQAGIRYGARTGGMGGYYGGYDYGTNASASASDRAAIKSEEMAGAYDTRVEGWKLIDDATADIRKTLTKKYGVEF